jgi:hypothetical protein
VAVAVAGATLLLCGLLVVDVSAVGGSAPVTLYAGASASGLADCSSAANACTLSTALAESTAGDVVALATAGVEGTASTYYSGGFSIATSGTSASFPVVIEPAPGVTDPILDGGGTQGVLDVTDNMHLVIEGVTIQNGNAGFGFGGGITNNSGGNLTVNDSTFEANVDSFDGAAIDNGDNGGSGVLTVSDSTFTNNTDPGNDGGAIDNGDLEGDGTLAVNDSTFTNNTAVSDGGAIDNGDGHGSGTLTVSDSTFAGNTAFVGGAIGNGTSSGDGTLTVSDSTLVGNTANQQGGAIDNGDAGNGTLTVSDSTFAGNTSSTDRGESIDNGDDAGTGTGAVAADIFADSCLGAGTLTDVGYNVGSDTTCQNAGTGDAVSASLASELGPLADNGGPTQTMQLLAGNPAAGLVPNGSGVLCPLADQTGATSPPGAPCNAGALQIHPSVKSVKIAGTQSVPKVTVTGSGFGIVGNLGPAFAAACGATGFDYANTLSVVDVTRSWDAGRYLGATRDCIGLLVTKYSGTKIVFHFGNQLGCCGGMHKGDMVAVAVFGTTTTITAPL